MKTKWIPYPTILEGETVDLIPLKKNTLKNVYRSSRQRTLGIGPTDCSDRTLFYQNYELALSQRETENQYPFVIRHKKTGKLIGSTCFFEIFPSDRKLEIGWTWITKDFWGTSVNSNVNYSCLPSASKY
jgi:RimJ/RimL family protein N-acetyltransferase